MYYVLIFLLIKIKITTHGWSHVNAIVCFYMVMRLYRKMVSQETTKLYTIKKTIFVMLCHSVFIFLISLIQKNYHFFKTYYFFLNFKIILDSERNDEY